MSTKKKVLAIIGSYRKKGIIDSAVSEILSEVEKQNVETKKIYLSDHNIEFCTNCRSCMQEPGLERGKCILEDDMEDILCEIENTDYLIIGAPVNFNNVNALTRKFMERCAGFGYWPWGNLMPKIRNKKKTKKVVLVSSSAAPAWMGKYFSGAMGALKMLARLLSAKPVGVIWVGLVNEEHMQLPDKSKLRAQALGRKLIG